MVCMNLIAKLLAVFVLPRHVSALQHDSQYAQRNVAKLQPSLAQAAAQGTETTCLGTGAEAMNQLLNCSNVYFTGIPASTQHKLPAPIYVNHGSRFKDRKDRLTQIFQTNGIDKEVTWLDNFDEDKLGSDVRSCVVADGPAFDRGWFVSVATFSVFRHMVEQNIPFSIIMEDDPVFPEGGEESFAQNLLGIWKNSTDIALFDKYDMLFFGGCQDQHGTTQVHGNFFKGPGTQVSRCANGYIVTLKAAQKMLAVFRNDQPDGSKKAFWPIDWMFDKVAEGSVRTPGCEQLKSVWLEPPLYNNGVTSR